MHPHPREGHQQGGVRGCGCPHSSGQLGTQGTGATPLAPRPPANLEEASDSASLLAGRLPSRA